MNCPDCGSSTIAFTVPEHLSEHANDEPALALCTHCLSLHPAPENDTNPNPDFAAVSDAFPTNETAPAMALVVGLLDSLALYRAEIESLLEHIERNGVDPLLVLDRLASDPKLDPKTNLTLRRRQVAQLRD